MDMEIIVTVRLVKKEEGVRFSLTSEATATISELGAKIERYNFNF